jgi:hypothetical protein
MHSSIDESEKREEQRIIIRFHMAVSIRMNLRALVRGYAKINPRKLEESSNKKQGPNLRAPTVTHPTDHSYILYHIM